MFLDHFDVLMSKINFFLNIILMCFGKKSILKSNWYHTPKHTSSIHTQKIKKKIEALSCAFSRKNYT